MLSQAGRLTLIKSIIFAMQVYWARTFVLPFKLIKMIRSAIMRFFWTGRTMGRYLAPIKFSSLEIPLNKGGLGLFNLKQWNKTAFAKHIDTLYNNPDSLWARWSEMNVIKGKNLWNMNKPQNLSWTWQCIFKLKDHVLPLIQMNTDPIYKVKFWDDPWLDKGYIIRRKLSYNEIIQTGIHLSTYVLDVLHIFQGVGKNSSNQNIQIIWDKIRHFTPLQSILLELYGERRMLIIKLVKLMSICKETVTFQLGLGGRVFGIMTVVCVKIYYYGRF
jgi:hypothetical protein